MTEIVGFCPNLSKIVNAFVILLLNFAKSGAFGKKNEKFCNKIGNFSCFGFKNFKQRLNFRMKHFL